MYKTKRHGLTGAAGQGGIGYRYRIDNSAQLAGGQCGLRQGQGARSVLQEGSGRPGVGKLRSVMQKIDAE